MRQIPKVGINLMIQNNKIPTYLSLLRRIIKQMAQTSVK